VKVVMIIVIKMIVHKRYILIYNFSIQNAISIKYCTSPYFPVSLLWDSGCALWRLRCCWELKWPPCGPGYIGRYVGVTFMVGFCWDCIFCNEATGNCQHACFSASINECLTLHKSYFVCCLMALSLAIVWPRL